jgi:hypothetical protein
VGVLVALTYAAAIDDPARFKSSKATGAHFGLTPKKYQSGETDVTGRISKMGDASVRTALYEAANVILNRPVKGSWLKSWAMRLAKRADMRKAKVALARKLAVTLHRMLADGTEFVAGKAAAKTRKRERSQVRADRHQPLGAGLVAGTMVWSGRTTGSSHSGTALTEKLADRSSSNPIRWRHRADPGQKQDTAERPVTGASCHGGTARHSRSGSTRDISLAVASA